MDNVFGIGDKNIGIDLGTANTIVYVEGKGIVLREPSVVAKSTKSGEVIAVGEEARAMIGRTPASINAVRPMKDGVIADYDTTVAMMKYFIQKALGHSSGKPYVMVCVPTGITAVEKRAVIDATRVAGARDAYVIEEPFAAAIGAAGPLWIRPVVWLLILVGAPPMSQPFHWAVSCLAVRFEWLVISLTRQLPNTFAKNTIC